MHMCLCICKEQSFDKQQIFMLGLAAAHAPSATVMPQSGWSPLWDDAKRHMGRWVNTSRANIFTKW